MLPRLVPEILSKCAFCDEVGAGAGIGDSRSLMGEQRFRFPQWWMWQSCSSKRDDRLNFPPASSFSAAMPSPESYPPAVSLVKIHFREGFQDF